NTVAGRTIDLVAANPRWHLYARSRYDLLNQAELDQLLGFGYESCCWAFRLIQRNYRLSSTLPVEQQLILDFEFKGLGTVGGKRIDSYLKNDILGYESKPR
ncbi:MAG: hypothetical protein OEX12_12020, partial [Gammaproteobacteria bacterium]|nr:hypothetical protein [Gammaproteobacteria bacterium]